VEMINEAVQNVKSIVQRHFYLTKEKKIIFCTHTKNKTTMNCFESKEEPSSSSLAASKRNTLLVLGEAGAGKSTFINALTELECCNVSHEKNVDGPHTSARLNFKIFDTVGLGSKNFRSSVPEISHMIDKDKASDNVTNVAIMLVCRRDSPRWTIWLDDFRSVISKLCANKPKVIVYWVRTGASTIENDEREMRNALKDISCDFIRHMDTTDWNDLVQQNLNQFRGVAQSVQSNVPMVNPLIVSPSKKSTKAPTSAPQQPETSIFKNKLTFQAKASSGERKNHPLRILRVELTAAINARNPLGLEEYSGRLNLLHTLMCQAIYLGIDNVDVENAVSTICGTDSLVSMYDKIAHGDAALNHLADIDKVHAIEALVWRLYTSKAPGKLKKNALAVEYLRIMRMFTEKLVLMFGVAKGVAEPAERVLGVVKGVTEPAERVLGVDEGVVERVFEVDEGVFENYVNTQSSDPTEILRKLILDKVNKVIHQHPATAYAELAGSRKHHTNVQGMSDIDIWVLCTQVIDQQMRTEISESIKREMRADFPGLKLEYKTNATTFTWSPTVEFDVVFDKNSFSPHGSGRPNREDFYDRPGRQRAVKAFKLLQRDAPDQFTDAVTSGEINDFVVSVDKANGGIHDSSGAHLFKQCLLDLRHKTIDDAWTAAARAVCNMRGAGAPPRLKTILGNMGFRYVGE
jgi:energy-coupling factor transporter ATP-binding protein EcfA2